MSPRALDELKVEDFAEIPLEGVSLLWANDYWDGPLNGMARFGGEMLWFCLAGDLNTNSYWLVRLTQSQLAKV